MALTQVEFLKSLPYPPHPSGRYFWTTTLYIDNGLFVNDAALLVYCGPREAIITRANVLVHGRRTKRPIGRGNVTLQQVFTTPSPGGVTAVDQPLILCIARWRLFDDFGNATYRMNRFPLGEAEVVGGMLSPSAYAQQVTMLNTFLFPGRFRNHHGNILTSGEVSPKVHMWQMRHGTKRSQENFWLP